MRDNFGAYWLAKILLLFFATPMFGWGFVPLLVGIFYCVLLLKEGLLSDLRVLSRYSPAPANCLPVVVAERETQSKARQTTII